MKRNQSKKGFTLVEIMIVVVIIGLLAAMAIPAFQKVRQNSRRSALINDGRQIGAAAQQYFLENNVTTVAVSYTTTNGAIAGDLSAYVKQIGTGYSFPDATIEAEGGFTMQHPLVKGGHTGAGDLNTPVIFNAEGQIVEAITAPEEE